MRIGRPKALLLVMSVLAIVALLAVACGPKATATPTPAPTNTPTTAPTATPVPPTATATPPAPTATPTKAATTPATGGATPTATATATKVPPTPTATPTPAPTATPSTKPMADKQEFRINLAGEPDTIDPQRSSFSTEITIVKQLFNGLLGFNQDLSLRPVTATEVPSVGNGGISADGLTYTFKLRPEVKWSDGKPVTAADYVYGIKRMEDPDLPPGDYATFYYIIKGAEAYNSSGTMDKDTKTALRERMAVKAVDDKTLQITLEQPKPTFLQLMALWPVYPARQDIIEKYGAQWTEAGNLIGNGPFVLKEWVHQDHITLTANPNYWGAKPKLQTITMKMITDVNAELAAYKNNELDMSRVPPGTEKATMADPTMKAEILRFAELTTFGAQFNVKKAPFDNKTLRQALSMAIDRVAFVDQVRGGVGQPAYSWVPPGMPGYDKDAGLQYKFDPAKAKATLTQAGYADPSKLKISFQYSDSAGNRTIAQFIQAQLKQNLGLDVGLEPMESKAFQAASKAHELSFFFQGWGADYPDPDNWLPETFGCGAGNNKMDYCSAQFDALSKQALAELDNTKRIQLWMEAQRIAVDDVPMVFFYYRERFWLLKPWVTDLLYTGMDGLIPGDFFYDKLYIAKH